MDFWGTIQVILRRWYVSIPAFLLAIAAGLLAYASVPSTYVSSAVLVLSMPTTGGTTTADGTVGGGITNPLLDFGQGTSLTASLLIEALGNPETGAELGVSQETRTAYTVTNGSSNPEIVQSGPFVFIEGTSAVPADAQAIVSSVSKRATEVLQAMQQKLGAPTPTHITVSEVVPPTSPTLLTGNKLRAGGALAALAVCAGLAASFAAESILSTRGRRRRRTRDLQKAPDSSSVPLSSHTFRESHSERKSFLELGAGRQR